MNGKNVFGSIFHGHCLDGIGFGFSFDKIGNLIRHNFLLGFTSLYKNFTFRDNDVFNAIHLFGQYILHAKSILSYVQVQVFLVENLIQMDEDPFLAPPKRTTAHRNLALDPSFAHAFQSSLHTPVPNREKVSEEPWTLPGFEKPDAFAAQKAKNAELDVLRKEFSQVSTPDQQVKDLQSRPPIVEEVPQFTTKIVPKLPKFIQRKLQQ
jgi:hypothetical protein